MTSLVFIILFAISIPGFEQAYIIYYQDKQWSNNKNKYKQIVLYLDTGQSYVAQSPDSALVYSQKALNTSLQMSFKSGQAAANLLAAKAFNAKKEFNKALAIIENPIIIFQSDSNETKLAECFYEKGYAYYYSGINDSSLIYSDKALAFFNPEKHRQEIANTLSLKGLCYWNMGRYTEGLTNINNSLSLLQQINDTAQIASALNIKGAAFWGLGNHERALECFFESLYLREKINADAGELMISYNNIGIVYQSWQHGNEAFKYYKKGEKLIPETNNQTAIAYTFLNLGTHYIEINKTDSAMHYLNLAKEGYSATNDINGICLTKIRIAQSETINGNFLQAEDLLRSAIEDSHISKNKHREALARYHLAENELAQNNYNQSLEFSFQSLELAKSGGYKDLLFDLYRQLSDIYENMSDFKYSLEMLKKAALLKDEIYQENFAIQQELLQLTQEYEQKELENITLKTQNQAKEKIIRYQTFGAILIFLLLIVFFIMNYSLSKKKKQLQEANQAKDKIFSIVAHDLRGPVGNLNNMIDLMVSENMEKNYRNILNTFKPVITNSYNMLENLLVWAKSNLGNLEFEGSNIPLQKTIGETIIPFLNIAAQKSINIDFKTKKEIIVFADVILLQTIIRNLLNNAIKFSNEGGSIIIEAETTEKQAVVSVADTGIGIPEEKQEHLFEGKFHATGTREEKGSGLGLMLCYEMAVKNGGSLWFKSTRGHGSTFSFSVPVVQDF